VSIARGSDHPAAPAEARRKPCARPVRVLVVEDRHVSIMPPDGAAPVEVIALVVRVERDRVVLSFVYLASTEARRLGDIVQRVRQS
jgi:hypothetical protein